MLRHIKETPCGNRFGSMLAQVMTWCLTAPSHYLNQCWLIIKGGIHLRVNFTVLMNLICNMLRDRTLKWSRTEGKYFSDSVHVLSMIKPSFYDACHEDFYHKCVIILTSFQLLLENDDINFSSCLRLLKLVSSGTYLIKWYHESWINHIHTESRFTWELSCWELNTLRHE